LERSKAGGGLGGLFVSAAEDERRLRRPIIFLHPFGCGLDTGDWADTDEPEMERCEDGLGWSVESCEVERLIPVGRCERARVWSQAGRTGGRRRRRTGRAKKVAVVRVGRRGWR